MSLVHFAACISEDHIFSENQKLILVSHGKDEMVFYNGKEIGQVSALYGQNLLAKEAKYECGTNAVQFVSYLSDKYVKLALLV